MRHSALAAFAAFAFLGALGASALFACGRTANDDVSTADDGGGEAGADTGASPSPTSTAMSPGFDASLPPPIDCPAEAVSGADCTHQQGVLCTRPTGCCVCGGLAGVCAPVWVCSTPADNDPSCPASAPAGETSCAVDGGVHCNYCSANAVPQAAECLSAMTYKPCEKSGTLSCWYIGARGEHCD